MRRAVIFLFIALALAGVAWRWGGEAWPMRAAGDSPSGPPTGLRKCVENGRVLYTDGACASGAREQAVTGGAVTVVPGQRPSLAEAAASAASGLPNVRTLLVPPVDPDLQDKRIDALTGK